VAVILAAVTAPFAVIGLISWRSERRAKRLAKRRKQRIRFDEAPGNQRKLDSIPVQ
jgi:hypothetical protein